MAIELKNDTQTQLKNARESFTGKRQTEAQFYESFALAGIMNGEIKKTGNFKKKLTAYSEAFSESEKFDAMKAETIIRDQFKSRYGQTMNQMREGLMQREASIGPQDKTKAMEHALDIGVLIEKGETMPFYRAYDQQAVKLSRDLGITETGAKTLMKQEFKHREGSELYDYGKSFEKKYHLPKVEAEKNQRQSTRSRSRSRQFS